jgi:hypothetical protein
LFNGESEVKFMDKPNPPEWIYQTYGGVSLEEAETQYSKLNLHRPPEGYKTEIDMTKEPFRVKYMSSVPEQTRVLETITEPRMIRVEEFDPRAKISIKYREWEVVQWGCSSWVESRRDNEKRISIGRWQDHIWFLWQLKG